MGDTELIRSRGARALGAAMVAAAVLGLVLAVVGGTRVVLDFGAPLTLFGLLGWAAFWRPYVGVTDGGVTLANTLRTLEVPWPAIEGVDGRYGLRLTTAYGELTAWAASAPSGRARARGESSEAALAVTTRLTALREAGHLDQRTLERPAPTTIWQVPLLIAVAVLATAAIVGPLIP